MGSTSSRHDLYADVTDRIIAALERGVAPWVRPWNTIGGQPHNGASGHRYQGINLILTALAGFGDPRWYTFSQAKTVGGFVRKGERGTKIVFWNFLDRPSGSDKEDHDRRRSGKIPILRHYVVFNHEQIEWAEPEVKVDSTAVDPSLGFDKAAGLVATTGAVVRHGGQVACYSPAEDVIHLPKVEAFRTVSDYWATALHELVHWTGYESRLRRDLSCRFGSESYAAEELVAELGSAFLCSEAGVDGHLQHAEYIDSWLMVLRRDRQAIFTAARLAQQAADFVVGKAAQTFQEAA